MATAEFKATVGAVTASASVANAIGASSTAATTADTDVATAQTDFGTADTAYDTFAAAVIAITGDTYSATTDQFTFGGSTGLTHSQWATVGALLNTALTDFLAVKTDLTAAKAATAAAVTAATPTADVTLHLGTVANVADMNKFRNALHAITDAVRSTGILATGSASPRSI